MMPRFPVSEDLNLYLPTYEDQHITQRQHDIPTRSFPSWNYNTNYNMLLWNYSRLTLSRTFKGPGDLFEIEKVQDTENLTNEQFSENLTQYSIFQRLESFNWLCFIEWPSLWLKRNNGEELEINRDIT